MLASPASVDDDNYWQLGRILGLVMPLGAASTEALDPATSL